MKLRHYILLMIAMTCGGSAYSAEKHASSQVAVKEEKMVKKKTEKGDGKVNQAVVIGRALKDELIKGILETINYLTKTIPSLKVGSEPRLKMLERVLNLHMEEASYLAAQEQDSYEERVQKWKQHRMGNAPRMDTKVALAHWGKVAETAAQTIREYPQNPNEDSLLFKQGLAFQYLGKMPEAVNAFKTVIRKYPQAPPAIDAHFALGEYYFGMNDFMAAKSHFQATLVRPSNWYGWSLFKIGWCFYNLNEFRSSLDTWKSGVNYAVKQGDEGGALLKSELLRDMVLAFAELRLLDEAIAYFHQFKDEEAISRVLQVMATFYVEKGEFREAISVWRRLIKRFPLTPEALEGQREIVLLTWELKDINGLWGELEELIKVYGNGKEFAQKAPPALVDENRERIRKLALYYPKLVHKKVQSEKRVDLIAEARRGYVLYLTHYSRDKYFAEVSENLADLEYQRKDFASAGGLYAGIVRGPKEAATVYGDDGKVRENIHFKSAKNMMDAYNKDFEGEFKELIARKPDFKKPPIPLSKKALNFIDGCDLFATTYPNQGEYAKNCDAFNTEIYYRNGHKEEAKKRLVDLAIKYPGSKEGIAAVENAIPLMQDSQPELVAACQKFLGIPAYANSPLGAKIRDLLRGIHLTAIASEKSTEKRASLYEQEALKNPKGKDVDKLWFNAADDYLKTGQLEKAIAAYTHLVQNFPQSAAYPDSVLQLGRLLDKTFRFKEAGVFFVLFAGKFATRKEAAAAHQRACLLQIAADYRGAIAPCNDFARKYPQFGQDVIERIIDVAWYQGDIPTMTKVITVDYLPMFKLDANHRIAALYKIYRKGDPNQATAAANQIVSLFGQGGVSGEQLRQVAEIKFLKVAPAYTKQIGLKLVGGSVEHLQQSIQQISQGLQTLENHFAAVINTKDPFWGVAVFYQLAQAYGIFEDNLRNPPGINGINIEDIKGQLKESADTIGKKVDEYNAAALEAAKNFDVHNDWVVKTINAVNQREKKRVRVLDWVVEPDFVSSKMRGTVANEILDQ